MSLYLVEDGASLEDRVDAGAQSVPSSAEPLGVPVLSATVALADVQDIAVERSGDAFWLTRMRPRWDASDAVLYSREQLVALRDRISAVLEGT